jgi:HEAT repeat protein
LWFKIFDLGASNNPSAMPVLKKVVATTGNEDVRAVALSAMGTLGAESELDALKKTYGTLGNIDTFMLLKAIGDIGTPAAIEFLTAQKDSDLYKDEGGMSYCIDLYVQQ